MISRDRKPRNYGPGVNVPKYGAESDPLQPITRMYRSYVVFGDKGGKVIVVAVAKYAW
jgi:hypothetical protein